MLQASCLGLLVAGCASENAQVQPGLQPQSTPPDQQAIEKAAQDVMLSAKLPGAPEISELRRAFVSAPADWLVCLRSNVPPFQPYALFLNGNQLVHYRQAVVYDDCAREMYVPSQANKEMPVPLGTGGSQVAPLQHGRP